jgi:hypothetical protein
VTVEALDGLDLVDAMGETVGTIGRTYVDEVGSPRMLCLSIGALLPTLRLVPADGIERTDGAVRTPYLKDVIEESPVFEGGDTLDSEILASVLDYYAHDGDLTAESADRDEAAQPAPMPPEVVTVIGELDQRNRPANDFPD